MTRTLGRGTALLVGAVLLAACGTTPTTSPTVTAGATPAATPGPTAPPSPTATGPAASGTTPTELQRTAEPLPAGVYTRNDFVPRIEFEVEGGTWRASTLNTGFFDIQDAPNTPDVIAVQFARPDGIYGAGAAADTPSNAAAAVQILQANTRLVVIETSESRMGGLVGSQVTVESPTSGTGTAKVMEVPPGTLAIDPGRRLWIAFFDTPDGLLAIMVGGSVATWDAALLLAEPVLESIVIWEFVAAVADGS